MKTANLPDGFVLVTQLRVMEREPAESEEPVYEPERKDIWIEIVAVVIALQFAAFYVYGIVKALQKVGLGG